MTETIQAHPSSSFNRPDEHEIDLNGVLNLIKHSYKLIVIITVICLIAAIYYAETRPPVYRSTAMIEVGGSGNSGISALGGSGAALLGLGSLQTSSADVETVLLRSPYILSQVISKMNLDISVSPQYSGFFARKLAEYRHVQSSAAVAFLRVPNSLLAKPLTLVVQKKNQYTLLTKNGTKILDGEIGRLESASYLSQPLQIKVTELKALPGAKFTVVKQSIPEVSGSLASNIDIHEEGSDTGVLALSYYSSNPEQAQKIANTVLTVALEKNLQEKSQEAATTLRFISHQLPISKINLQKADTKLNQYSVKSGIFNAESEGQNLSTTIHNLQKSLEKLKFKKMILLQKFTSLHPFVIAITQQENEVRSQINAVKAQLKKLPLAIQKQVSLERDAKVQAGIYTELEGDVQKMEMLKASTMSSVRILSRASYPTTRIPVKKRAIVLGGAFFGFILSLGIIFLRHVLSPVIEDPDVVERSIGVPVMAMIPYSHRQMTHNKQVSRDKSYGNLKPYLLSREHAKDIAIEGIRSLRTALQMSLLDAKDNVIAISGCSPSVGKSFISSNLAVLLSDLDKRVLVVDSDIRLGKLHECFGKAKTPGLSTFLQNQASLEQVIQEVMPGKLDLITAGTYPKNPSELLSQKSLGDLIHTLKNRYDVVILDTPPVLAVTDPALVLRYSSTNLVVVGVGKDQVKEVLHVKNMLEKSGVKLAGLIFNTVHQRKIGYGYGYGYGYGKYNYYYAYDK